MNLFPSPWELYSHPFPWDNFSIPRNILYPRIKFSKLLTNIGIYIPIILFPGINKYNLKQTHPLIKKTVQIDQLWLTLLSLINRT